MFEVGENKTYNDRPGSQLMEEDEVSVRNMLIRFV